MINATLHYYHTFDIYTLMVPRMTIELNHTIIAAHDRVLSANFLAEILGLPTPVRFGPFMIVKTDNHVSLDFMTTSNEIHPRQGCFYSVMGLPLNTVREMLLDLEKTSHEINTD